ncbi:hypothetical protein [Burkholderia alba]|uniref:hypothetical protein n=1 Tax=Burkholderia alba TaxID=2683677 RepID=UPI002B053F18|nr:hypothetical protein [Burkholderia alba]
MGRINWNSRGDNGTWEKSRHFGDLFATRDRAASNGGSAQPVDGHSAKSPMKIVSFCQERQCICGVPFYVPSRAQFAKIACAFCPSRSAAIDHNGGNTPFKNTCLCRFDRGFRKGGDVAPTPQPVEGIISEFAIIFEIFLNIIQIHPEFRINQHTRHDTRFFGSQRAGQENGHFDT